jgi:hypothetical protein
MMKRVILAAALATSLLSVAEGAQPRSQPILPSQQAFPVVQAPQEPQTLPAPREEAQQQPRQNASPPGPPPHRHFFLQRYKYSSYGAWVKTMGPGYPAYRYTYSGQKDNFPLPAIFQSGSEHTNYTGGPGF